LITDKHEGAVSRCEIALFVVAGGNASRFGAGEKIKMHPAGVVSLSHFSIPVFHRFMLNYSDNDEGYDLTVSEFSKTVFPR
jgi:hypothetical protein